MNDDKFGIDTKFIYKPPLIESLKVEYGSTQPIRFLIPSTSKESIRCIDCEAMSHLFSLQGMNIEDNSQLMTIKDALIWILENIDWPVGE